MKQVNVILSGTRQGVNFFLLQAQDTRKNHKIGRFYATNPTEFHVSFTTSSPEPSVFYGDPLRFFERSSSFKVIIERRCLKSTDKLSYRQRHIGGDAKSVLVGGSYRRDDETYNQFWDKLNSR